MKAGGKGKGLLDFYTILIFSLNSCQCECKQNQAQARTPKSQELLSASMT